MKIAIISTVYGADSGGAIGIITEVQANDLLEKQNDVTIFTIGKKNEETNVSGIKIFKIKEYEQSWISRAYLCVRNFRVEKRFREFLNKTKPDVVHFHGMYHQLPYSLIKIAKKLGSKTVVTIHDVMVISPQKLHHFIKKDSVAIDIKSYKISFLELLKQNGKAFNPFRNYFIRRYLRYADHILAVSNELKEVLSQNKINNVEVLHNGINIDGWVVSDSQISEFKKVYQLTNKKVLLIAGRLSGAKGVNETMLMLKEVVKKHPNTILLVACSKDLYSKQITDKAKEFGIEKNLILSGWLRRERMKTAYASSDVVLVPSIVFDSFPTVNLEAMASKKPVVGTCFGGTKEIIHNGINGFVINPFITKEFTEKVTYLIETPDGAKTMGQSGYDIVKSKFSQKEHMNKLIKIYDK